MDIVYLFLGLAFFALTYCMMQCFSNLTGE
jgi:hypothetical protein